MKVIRVYEYPLCNTCKDALKFLASRRYAVEKIDIFATPPTKAELKKMLEFQGGHLKKLFNTTGKVYQEMDLKTKLPTLSQEEAINLLAKNGKLVKRPFVLMEDKGLVGFKKEVWSKIFV